MSTILGYKIYDGSMEELFNKLINTDRKLHIVSGNPEVFPESYHHLQPMGWLKKVGYKSQ